MAAKEKRGFKMPHLMILILSFLLIMSVATYIIPAGQFATDPETGKLLGDQFTYLDSQTPISPWKAILFIKDGIVNSGVIIATLFAMGGATEIALKSKAIDNLIDFSIFKLKDKGIDVLVPALTVVFLFFGTFSGGDFTIAMVPIGLMIAKKLRLDPVLGFSIVISVILLGAISSPTHVMLPQMMMDVPLYSGFGMRCLLQIPVFIIITLYMWRYAKRVAKDPSNSVLGKSEWYDELDSEIDEGIIKEQTLDMQSIVITLLYFLQPVVIVLFTTTLGYGQEAIVAISLINTFLMGAVARMDLDTICNTFAKGLAGMAFVAFIIGCANAMSLVMSQGNILHTIVYTLCLPLKNLGSGLAAVGIAVVVTLINMLIPSASAKVAILCPIIAPMCTALGIPMQVGVTAFKYGDSVTNTISPVLGTIVGGLDIAKVPFNKYLQFIFPLVAILLIYCYISLYFLGAVGWTGL